MGSQQLHVYAGKGNKDRLTIHPQGLIKSLQSHLPRLGNWTKRT